MNEQTPLCSLRFAGLWLKKRLWLENHGFRTAVPKSFLDSTLRVVESWLKKRLCWEEQGGTVGALWMARQKCRAAQKDREAVAECSSSGNPRRIRRIPSLGHSLRRLTSRRAKRISTEAVRRAATSWRFSLEGHP